jgi:protein-S-isoprenylcysteine O-methyltransferase Ste14
MLSDPMGAGEIILVAALAVIFLFSSQLPKMEKAMEDRPGQERRFWVGVLVILGALLLVALYYAITHALQGA